jgi:hypothetical protein
VIDRDDILEEGQARSGYAHPSAGVPEEPNRRPHREARWQPDLRRWDERTAAHREADILALRERMDQARSAGLLHEEDQDEPHHRERGES